MSDTDHNTKSEYIDLSADSEEYLAPDEDDDFNQDTKCSRPRIIGAVVIGVAVVALALGLGLGLGLHSSEDIPEEDVKVCQQFHREESSSKKTTGNYFLENEECPDLGESNCPSGLENPPLLLIALDGFRPDYLERNLTPTIQKLSDCGVNAPYMRAVYPTKTFPTYYSIVTGLYPESHGIIDNNMYDMDFGAMFKISDDTKFEGRWYEGEPLWNTAKKAGKGTATLFWPGSDAYIQEMHPDVCYIYNKSVAYEDRVDEVLKWLRAEPDDIPAFMTLYFDQPDTAGHYEGPFGDQVNKNISYVDDMMKMLMDGLKGIQMDKCLNIIILSGHGLEKIDCSKNVNMSAYLQDMNNYYAYQGAFGRLSSKYVEKDGRITETDTPEDPSVTMDKLACLHHNTTKDWFVRFSLKEDVPKRYHYANHRRIDDIIMDVEAGSLVIRGSYWCEEGNHGYDNALRNLHGLFLAYGPSFKQQVEIEPFESIELYNLMADLIGVEPSPNNGTEGVLHHMLLSPPAVENNQKLTENTPYDDCPYPETETEREARRESFHGSCKSNETNTTVIEEWDSALNLDEEEKATSSKKHLPLGIPEISLDDVCQLHQEDFITGYSKKHFMPIWSAFSLSKEQLQNQTEHHTFCVRQDVRLTKDDTAICSEYTDKEEGIIPTFLYPPSFIKGSNEQLSGHISSNLVPMYEAFFYGIWSETLSLLQEYATKYEKIEVLTGPIFDHNADGHADLIDEIEKKVAGGKVPLPTHYFVTAHRCNSTEEFENCEKQLFISIILPHKPNLDNCMNMWKFEYLKYNMGRVKDVELLTNLNLFPSLNKTQKLPVQTFLPVRLWERKSWMDLDDDEGCPTLDTPSCPDHYNSSHPPLILISIDGFRSDYLKRGRTPTLERLSSCGTSAPYMRSIYPTLTFPNHYSLITGLYPESHGLIDNSMYDMSLKESFYLGSPNMTKSHWWSGEPLWNTVVKNKKSAMCIFWAGSDVEIGGLRPTDYYDYNGAVPYRERVDQVLRWLDGSVGSYPSFITVYFSNVDSAGHDSGPNSFEVSESLEYIDQYIKQLMDGLHRMSLDQCVNVIITSDHGMTDISCNRSILLRDVLGDDIYTKTYSYLGGAGRISNKYIRSSGNYVHLDDDEQVPVENITDILECDSTNLATFNKLDFPRRHHYAANDRIDDIILHMIDTWMVSLSSPWCPIKGQHGWDPAFETMWAFFLGYGPGLQQQFTTEPFENIELYNVMAHLIGVEPAPNNGTDGSLHHILRNPPPLPTKEPQDVDYCSFPEDYEDYERRANLTNADCMCNVSQENIWESDNQLNFTLDQQAELENQHIPHGIPRDLSESSLCIAHQNDFISGYSSIEFMPLWTAFTLTSDQIQNDDWLVDCLRPDVRLEPYEQANCTEYEDSLPHIQTGYLFPPELSNSSKTVMDSLILSNVAPMMATFDTEVWVPLFKKISQWTLTYEKIHVVTGPIFDYDADGHKDQEITRYLHNSLVPIPSHFYTVLLKCPVDCTEKGYDILSFILPNKQGIANCKSLDDYLVDNVARIRDIELLTDLEFLTANNTLMAIRKRLFIPLELWS